MINEPFKINISGMSDENSVDKTTGEPQTQSHFTVSFLSLGFVMVGSGAVGNSLIVFNILMLGSSRTLYDLLLLNVSLADLALTGCWLPLFVLDVSNHLHISDTFCDFIALFVLVVWPVSIISFTVLSVTRYLHVCRNYHNSKWRWRTPLFCAFIWVLGVILALPAVLLHSEHHHATFHLFLCTVGCLQGFSYPRPYTIFIAIVPQHAVVYCNIAIYRHWFKAQRNLKVYKTPSEPNVIMSRKSIRSLLDSTISTSFVVLASSEDRSRAEGTETVEQEVSSNEEDTRKPVVQMNKGFAEQTAGNQSDPQEKCNLVHRTVLKSKPVSSDTDEDSNSARFIETSVDPISCSSEAQWSDLETSVDHFAKENSQLTQPDQPTNHTECEILSDLDMDSFNTRDTVLTEPPSSQSNSNFETVKMHVAKAEGQTGRTVLAARTQTSTYGKSQKWMFGIGGSRSDQKTVRHMKQEKALLQGMLVVVATSVVSVVPYGIITVADAIHYVPWELLVVSSLLRFISNAFNWIVYVLLIPTVQQRYAAFCRKLVNGMRCSRAAPL